MKNYWTITVVAGVVLCACGVRSNRGRSSVSQPITIEDNVRTVSADPVNGLRVARVAASRGGDFSIELENASKGVLKLWRGSNSWGAACWRVLLIRDGHLEVFYQNPDQGFTKNGPEFNEIPAGGRVKVTLNLNGGDWCGLGHCAIYNQRGFGGKVVTLDPNDRLIVTYDVPVTQEARNNGVWYGVIGATAEVQQ